MNEKCFCHLNGYAVKDAAARANIGEILNTLTGYSNRLTALEKTDSSVSTEISGIKNNIDNITKILNELSGEGGGDLGDLAGDIAAIETELESIDARLTDLEDNPAVDLSPLESRVKALEDEPDVDLSPLEERVTALENSSPGEGGAATVSLYKNLLSFTIFKKTVENEEYTDVSDYTHPYANIKLTFLTSTDTTIIERFGYTYTSTMTFGLSDSVDTVYKFFKALYNYRLDHGAPLTITGTATIADNAESDFNSLFNYSANPMGTGVSVEYKTSFNTAGDKYQYLGNWSELQIPMVYCKAEKLI